MENCQIHKNFSDIYDGIIPKRVPIGAILPLEFCIQYADLDLAETQWTLDGVYEAADELCNMLPLEMAPLGTPRYPAYLTILKAKTYKMGESGFMQHPEIEGMLSEEYPLFNQNPRDFIIQTVFPRLFENWDTDPINRTLLFSQALLAYKDYQTQHLTIVQKLRKNHDFHTPPAGSIGGVTVPFDYLADFLRGFTGITIDVKRRPEMILEACEAVLPFLLEKGLPANPSKYGQTFIPLHKGTYLREKEFKKLYWPSFKKLVQLMADAGQPAYIFCEDDWTRYLDYLQDLPEGTRFCFEYGDPVQIKKKLGHKHILSGLYPIRYLKTATKQECIDKAKKLMDILAPGGNYIFNFDKNPFVIGDVDLDNYKAVLEFVLEYGRYDNSGQKSRETLNREFSQDTLQKGLKYESKYGEFDYSNVDFVGKELGSTVEPILKKYHQEVFNFLIRLV